MTGRLNGVEVEVDARWSSSGITGEFRADGPGAHVIADAFAANNDVTFSGPVERNGKHLDVVVLVRIETFPTRGEPETKHRGTFRAAGEPIEVTHREEHDTHD